MTEQQKHSAPSEKMVPILLKAYLPGVSQAVRVPEGVSTYVYRVETGRSTCYARFLPEDATFGVEVLVHKLLGEIDIPVPEVLAYVPREPVTGLSLIVVSALPGSSMKASMPAKSSQQILKQAGAALAKLHTLPVDGFGWIDRTCETALKGEHSSFSKYFTEFLESDLAALEQCGVSAPDRSRIRALMEEALNQLHTEQAFLVHGDFCLDHIFQKNGTFTGFIDFGEIRGSHPFFDLGAFLLSDPTPGQQAFSAILEGYGTVRPLRREDLRAVKLNALSFALRFTGKKAGTPAEGFWAGKLREELNRIY